LQALTCAVRPRHKRGFAFCGDRGLPPNTPNLAPFETNFSDCLPQIVTLGADMRRLIDIGFFLLIAVACAGLDFYIMRRDAGGDLAFSAYAAQRREDIGDLLHPPSLGGAMPTALAGWDVSTSGVDQMTEGGAEARKQQASEIAMVKAIAALEKAKHPKGDMVGLTMTKGNTRLRVMAVLVEKTPQIAGIETAASQESSTDPALQAALHDPTMIAQNAAYTVVDGVAFVELPASAVSGDPALRMMRAQMGDELSVTIVTKSTDDAAIREAMQGINLVMLNKLLQSPVVGVADGLARDLRFDPANGAGHGTGQPIPAIPPAIQSAAPSEGPATPVAQAAPIAPVETASAQPTASASAKAKAEDIPAESAVFVAPPTQGANASGQPCVRRAGVLICPDG